MCVSFICLALFAPIEQGHWLIDSMHPHTEHTLRCYVHICALPLHNHRHIICIAKHSDAKEFTHTQRHKHTWKPMHTAACKSSHTHEHTSCEMFWSHVCRYRKCGFSTSLLISACMCFCLFTYLFVFSLLFSTSPIMQTLCGQTGYRSATETQVCNCFVVNVPSRVRHQRSSVRACVMWFQPSSITEVSSHSAILTKR